MRKRIMKKMDKLKNIDICCIQCYSPLYRHFLYGHRNKPHYKRCFQEVTFELPFNNKNKRFLHPK